MPDQELHVFLSVAGRYVSANDAALRLLGYELSELRSLPLGALSGASEEAAAAVWRRIVAGDIPVPRDQPGQLRTRSGDLLAVQLLDIEPAGEPEVYVVRMRLTAGRRIVTNAPGVLHLILDAWRAAERDLAAATDDASRIPLSREIDELRALYQRESSRFAEGAASEEAAGPKPG